MDLFAGMSVSDLPAALAWYEKLFGKPPAFFPNEVEAVWEVAAHRYVYIELRPEHAGHGLITLFLEDFDSYVAEVSERGIQPATVEKYENDVRKWTYLDPDGNEIGLGGGPDG